MWVCSYSPPRAHFTRRKKRLSFIALAPVDHWHRSRGCVAALMPEGARAMPRQPQRRLVWQHQRGKTVPVPVDPRALFRRVLISVSRSFFTPGKIEKLKTAHAGHWDNFTLNHCQYSVFEMPVVLPTSRSQRVFLQSLCIIHQCQSAAEAGRLCRQQARVLLPAPL